MASAEKPAPGEQDLKYAAEFRDWIHREVLDKARKIDPGIETVIDPYPVESYFQWSWEYPGAWYLVVAIPEGFRSRDACFAYVAPDTGETPDTLKLF